MKSWLCQIAKNIYYSHVRAQIKQNNMKAKVDVNQEVKAVSAIVEEKIIGMHIKKIIQELEERDRNIVEYRLFGELPYKEIGILLDLKDATVKVLFSRAKVKIQKRLKEEYGYEI